MKILLGGVPFGRNNIGDEAILEGLVKMIRSIKPDAEICVSTGDPQTTSDLLKVKTCELMGFSHVAYNHMNAEKILKEHDLFIWSGATGLSDYPDDGMALLKLCRKVKTPAVIFGTGMNSELNPAKFKLQAGRKKDLLNCFSKLSCNIINFPAIYERKTLVSMLETMNTTLQYPKLIVLRNEDSRLKLSSNCKDVKAQRGADLALVLDSDETVFNRIDSQTRFLLGQKRKKIALCISAQRQVDNINEFAKKIDYWIDKYEANVFLVPMNPITDAKLMEGLKEKMIYKQHCSLVEGCLQPREVVALTSKMDAVISSRLHLLILSSINHIPIIGISRGSKVDTFLKRYGLQSCGSVERVDLMKMEHELDKFLLFSGDFVLRSKKIRTEMLKDLKLALDMLKQLLLELEEKKYVCTT